jgi:hypothetical protein
VKGPDKQIQIQLGRRAVTVTLARRLGCAFSLINVQLDPSAAHLTPYHRSTEYQVIHQASRSTVRQASNTSVVLVHPSRATLMVLNWPESERRGLESESGYLKTEVQTY